VPNAEKDQDRTNAQQGQILADIFEGTARPEMRSLDHTQPGALDGDFGYISSLIQCARQKLGDPLPERFQTLLARELDALATFYHFSKEARSALQKHADEDLERVNKETGHV
jgi:hypothetical protein